MGLWVQHLYDQALQGCYDAAAHQQYLATFPVPLTETSETLALTWAGDAAGQQECEDAVALLEEEARKVRQSKARLRMAPAALYAGLPAAAQLAAFEPAPRGYRKARHCWPG